MTLCAKKCQTDVWQHLQTVAANFAGGRCQLLATAAQWIAVSLCMCLCTLLGACQEAATAMPSQLAGKEHSAISISQLSGQDDYLQERLHIPLNTNLMLTADSLNLACLPLKNCINMLYKGEHVVVAEIKVDTTLTCLATDSVWFKLAHSETVQGWVSHADIKQRFVPTDSISQAISLFSDSYVGTSIFIITTFVLFWLISAYQSKPFKLVFFNDIDSLYPLFFCLMVSICATLYESIQLFAPDSWETYYYAPQFSPFGLPPLLGFFIACLWLMGITFIATLSEIIQRLSLTGIFFYLVGLAALCVFCYQFFILSTAIYLGYAFLLAFMAYFAHKAVGAATRYPYICGQCGQKLRKKGVCPHCGTINQ